MGCVFKNIISVLKFQRGRFPFVKTEGFPICTLGMSQIENSLPITSVYLLNNIAKLDPSKSFSMY